MRVTSTCATMLMHIAIPKSTNPTPIIAGRCNEAGEASTNSLAIMLDIVCPGPKSDSGMAFIPVAFPISIVTAIVSPTARPNPRMDAPISPVFAYGNIASRNISQTLGLDILTASVVLAIMIIPTVSAVSREVLMAVPQQQREAAYMLGATRWEMFRLAMFPYAKTGLIGASILGLGRAVGETIAVTMLIGNATGINAIPESLFGPGQTMSSIIANEFVEASPASLHLPAIIGVGLVLLGMAICINIVAHVLVTRMLKVREGAINN